MATTLVDKEAKTVILGDQRVLAYSTYGVNLKDSKYPPVLYFHGFPGSRLEAALLHEMAIKSGLHIIAIDRPGIGRSSPQKERTVLDWPKDVISLLDNLRVKEFAIFAISGGAPFAMACLKEISSERLKAVSVVSGAYPTSLGTAGMLFKNRVLMWAASWSPTAVGFLLDFAMGKTARDEEHPEKLYELMETELASADRPQVDRECFESVLKDPKRVNLFIESVRESFAGPMGATAWEAWLLSSDWGFKLENVDTSRLTMWHGGKDVNVPVAMADKAAELLDGVEYKRLDEEGHFSLSVNHAEDAFAELVTRLN